MMNILILRQNPYKLLTFCILYSRLYKHVDAIIQQVLAEVIVPKYITKVRVNEHAGMHHFVRLICDRIHELGWKNNRYSS